MLPIATVRGCHTSSSSSRRCLTLRRPRSSITLPLWTLRQACPPSPQMPPSASPSQTYSSQQRLTQAAAVASPLTCLHLPPRAFQQRAGQLTPASQQRCSPSPPPLQQARSLRQHCLPCGLAGCLLPSPRCAPPTQQGPLLRDPHARQAAPALPHWQQRRAQPPCLFPLGPCTVLCAPACCPRRRTGRQSCMWGS